VPTSMPDRPALQFLLPKQGREFQAFRKVCGPNEIPNC
jgi:hypothetical protein